MPPSALYTAAVDTGGAMQPIRYEFRSETSSKFWEGSVRENSFTVRFGKIGTDGQVRVTTHASADAAHREHLRRTREKLAEGYKPTAKDRMRCYDGSPSGDPAFVASEYVGEHVEEAVLVDLCAWLTACIRSGMTAAQFARVWARFWDGHGEMAEALDQVYGDDDSWDSWGDNLQEGDIEHFYQQAVTGHADRFIWFNNNAYVDIVACHGDPGARALCIGVLTEGYCKNEQAQLLTGWPRKLGPGAPILNVLEAYPPSCTLRDGRNIRGRDL
ncbi:WGR domain-containing protein [Candidatus Uhrbacteria bacterium]|nr:WGR domain-containing protein [Candidatus Uhrbacteria bacterium]